jgi:hypothetical protein
MKSAKVSFVYLYKEGDLIPLPTKENRYRSQSRKRDLYSKKRRLGPVATSLRIKSNREKEFNQFEGTEIVDSTEP